MQSSDWDRYAQDYHNHIVSPLQDGVENPIFSDIEDIDGKSEKIVADIGAGRGELLSFLAERFRKAYAIDFSPQMLRIAKESNSEYRNIEYIEQDIRQLDDLEKKFDLIIAVNSVLLPSFSDVRKSLRGIYSSLDDAGIFIGIFPAMESVIHHSMLVYEKEHERYGNEDFALKTTRKIIERKKYSFITSIFDDDGDKQKFFYRFELRHRLKEAGFRNIEIKKVKYPWGDSYHGFEDFPGKPKMWDWYVIAKKS